MIGNVSYFLMNVNLVFSTNIAILEYGKKWRKIFEKKYEKTMKHGRGSIMVCGFISRCGVDKLVFIEETMDSI